MNMTAFTADQTRHHPPVPPDHEVIIVGAGISGIGAAIQLKADGVNDILILERDNDVGGTWRDMEGPDDSGLQESGIHFKVNVMAF